MKKYLPAAGMYFALALGLGIVSAWPLDGLASLGAVTVSTALLFAPMLLFGTVLPRMTKLPMQIFIAMAGGTTAGWVLTHFGMSGFVTGYLGIFGALFILLLKLVIIPLIFVSVLCGVAGLGDVRKLGRLGAKTIAFYLMTTCMAVVLGMALVNTIRPGVGREELIEEQAQVQQTETAPSLGMQIQTKVLPALVRNPIMADENPIVIIFFAILLGAALTTIGAQAESVLNVFRALDKALIAIVLWVMALAPIGVFALMAKVMAEWGIEAMYLLAKYFCTVLLGLGLHFILLTCVLCPLLGRVSPKRFLSGMFPAFEVAFSTSSSSATLPVSVDCVTRRVGADENITGFMLPVGATVNMDGTALYVAVASLFIGQVYGVHLTFQAQFMVFLTAVLVSIGTAGIPGASIGLIGIILAAAGIPVEGIGIILGVDRILDMSRTVVNITGDSVGAVVVSRSEGMLHEPQASA